MSSPSLASVPTLRQKRKRKKRERKMGEEEREGQSHKGLQKAHRRAGLEQCFEPVYFNKCQPLILFKEHNINIIDFDKKKYTNITNIKM